MKEEARKRPLVVTPVSPPKGSTENGKRMKNEMSPSPPVDDAGKSKGDMQPSSLTRSVSLHVPPIAYSTLPCPSVVPQMSFFVT
jgi:hypothetical protein